MANNTVIGGKVASKRGGADGAAARWRWGRGARARRGRGSDDESDEEYVVGGDEDEGESSYDSYSSDASREADDAGCVEEEEEEEEDYCSAGEGEIGAVRGRRRRKGLAGLRREGKVVAPFVVDEEGMETPLRRKPRAIPRQRFAISAEEEGEEYDDDDDEDFAPDEDDDDEEELARASARKIGSRKNGPVKRQRKGRSRNSSVKEKRTKAPSRKKKKRRRRMAPTSDDDDFVVKNRRIAVEVSTRNKKRKISNGGKKRGPWASRSDPSESDSSDFDYTISVEDPRDLLVGTALGNLVRRPPSSGTEGEKGKGKDADELGKLVCRICLSEDNKRIIRGLLDCCNHFFCFACIMEWSKVESRCPLCKRRFETVSKLASSDATFGLRTTVIRIPERDQVYQPSEEEIRRYLDPYANVVCVECQQGGDDNLMLLCDLCDSPAHTYCVGLGREVPEGNWYCEGCRSADSGSSNSRVQESVAENGARSDRLQVNFHGEVDLEVASICVTPEPSEWFATLPHQVPSDGIGEAASSRYPTPLEDHETALRAPVFTASTVSGRRSIHHRIRTMISNNRIRWIPGVARNNVVPPSSFASDVFGYGAEQHGETFHVQQESLTNGIDEQGSRSFLGSRVNMHSCTHNEGSSCHIVETAKDFRQW